MTWASCVLDQLRSRNAYERSISSITSECRRLQEDLWHVRSAKIALERQTLTAAASSSLHGGDLSGLLSDTPVAPHLRSQLGDALHAMLQSSRSSPHRAVDPLMISAIEEVIARSLKVRGEAADRKEEANEEGKRDELRVADMESCFAAFVCRTLIVQDGDFELSRMQRLLNEFRELVANACYGTISTRVERSESEETPRDEQDPSGMGEASLDPVEEMAMRKARRSVARHVLELHQKLYTSEILLGEKHQEVVLCYQKMAERAKDFSSLQAQLTQLRSQQHKALVEARESKKWCSTLEEENLGLKKKIGKQEEDMRNLEASLLSLQRQLERSDVQLDHAVEGEKGARGRVEEVEKFYRQQLVLLGMDVKCAEQEQEQEREQ
ncbi:hypothetical protein GUITHDRAFT_115787 [Guillardia theta CCMP2712]|uniref:Uncharacterized protein n=1 Tax=Guillardia theta (strain CCMP2712) TaxID=905079 RepID=L1IQ64_GUITC|nr:hypothetical protein GUITHDRAFT_115787 [Guillardia theta CCMP2712]EKX38024.1 hypothetical protein GUITHDRAFT_115787 [Guillardia theta CCMP2712]|eukprot:XP_005825004.1 hypothetical protein GUITHDRAFT_115787 [Guillardia theta CCMP2712]